MERLTDLGTDRSGLAAPDPCATCARPISRCFTAAGRRLWR